VATRPAPRLAALTPAGFDTAGLSHLGLAEVIDIALTSSPSTQATWADAKVAAAQYGMARAARWPTLNLDGSAIRSDASGYTQTPGTWATTWGTSATLSWLLLDAGGRAGRAESARQGLIAANQTQNAALADRVLDVEVAFFAYAGAKALVAADNLAEAEAETSLTVAQELHTIGMATVADVLRARTALAQTHLEAQGHHGQVINARGALAVAMGYPANVAGDIDIDAPAVPVAQVSASVDSLVAVAVAQRPDLQVARARALAAAAAAQATRAAQLPSLALNGSVGESWRDGTATDRGTASVQLRVPLFSGTSAQHELAAAQAIAEAAGHRARSLAQRVVYEVFAAHTDLQTAARRLTAADEFVASADQSSAVALGRYREGVGTMLDLLSAQQTAAAARAGQINARLAWFTSLARLARHAGLLDLAGDSPLLPAHLHPEVVR
jgi:outer membrane protein TolC